MVIEWAAAHQPELLENWRWLRSDSVPNKIEPLQIDCFRQVAVDPEAGTLVWPNGVDLCPDMLYSEATGRPIASAAFGLSVEKSAVVGKLPVEANVTPA